MNLPPHRRQDDGDGDGDDHALDYDDYNNDNQDSNNDDDRLNRSDVFRHAGEILKRRGLLLEKKLLASSSPSLQYDNDDDEYEHVAVPRHRHDDATPTPTPPSNILNNQQLHSIITRQIINSNSIPCRDSCERTTPDQLSFPQQQQQQHNQHCSSQQVIENGNNNLSKGRRRALRWISDRAAQDKERRKNEVIVSTLSSSPIMLESAFPIPTITAVTTSTATTPPPPPRTTTATIPPMSTDKADMNHHCHHHHHLVSSNEDEVAKILARNTQATIHNQILKNDKTSPISKMVPRRHHHHRLVLLHEPSSSSSNSMATSQFKKKAIHNESDNGGKTTATTPMSNTMLPRCNRKPTSSTTPLHSFPFSYSNDNNNSNSYSYNNNNNNNNTLDPNTERLLRFHEAYNAIIRATTQHSNNEGEGRSTISARWLQSGGKRWTRDPNIVSAASIDGRVYEDLQRTPTLSLKRTIMKGTSNGTAIVGAATKTTHTLYDRAASWLSLVTPPKHTHHRGVVRRGPQNEQMMMLTNVHDTDNMKQNNGSNGSEEGKNALRSYQKILQGISSHQRNVVPIRQFSIDCRVPGSYNNRKQHSDAKRGGLVSISTLQLLFTGGRHALVSKPKQITTRVNKLHHRRSIFDKKFQERMSDESEMHMNGRRRALTKSSNAKDVSTVESANAANVHIRSMNTTEIIPPVSNVSANSPRSPQDRFNVIDFFKESLLYHIAESSIIDTDGTEVDIFDDDLQNETYNAATATPTARIQSMLMSPSLITKRYQQALKAIEHRNWKQVSRMINANPWLMEMKDVRNDQSLVHTLAFFGGELNSNWHYDCSSLEDSNPITNTHLPEQLVRDIIDYEPSAVHKIDIEGNLPLHMAAASGNVKMINELGLRFPGAASVQNHYGLLPLHLAVISCNDSLTSATTCSISTVELLIDMFPGAVSVKDHDGNLPLHTAAASSHGDHGARLVQLLQKAYHDWTMANARANNDNPLPLVGGMCKNNAGKTPLARAIQSGSGRDVVEALLYGEDGGKFAALEKDMDSRNALHLALDRNFHDASVVWSILKASPSTATILDGDGMLPIQIACRNFLQHEVILAICIIDLPIDLGSANGVAVMREGYGSSWWYLVCESNDEYVGVVHDILSLCSRPQKVALCLAKKVVQNDNTDCGSRHNRTVVSSATPRCGLELRKHCLFWNRFEIVDETTEINHAFMHKFDAIDHGGTQYDDPIVPDEGKRVSLYCYTDAKSYIKDVKNLPLHKRALDSTQFEKLYHLSKEDNDDDVRDDSPPHSVSYQYCIVADAPRKTLANVIAQMDSYNRRKYLQKSRLVLYGIAKSLYHLHTNSIIHGHIDSTTIGKFGSTEWKITGLIGSVVTGDHFPASRLGLHSPPEAFVVMQDKIAHEKKLVSVAPSLKAVPSVDVWAFGKLLYEVLVGESLFLVFLQKKMKSGGKYHHQDASKCILKWNEVHHLPKITEKLLSMGTSTTGMDLISKCLTGKQSRSQSMQEIVNHPFWERC